MFLYFDWNGCNKWEQRRWERTLVFGLFVDYHRLQGVPSYYALFQPILIVPSLEFSDVEACGPDTFNQV